MLSGSGKHIASPFYFGLGLTVKPTFDWADPLLLDASLAEMTTGVRSVAARIVQPFFRRPGGGSKIPIRISGTRTNPTFGLDVRRTFLPG